MDNYRKFELLRTTELQVTRKGFFNPVYTLTDGQFDYGKLSCNSIFQREKKIEAADGEWIIRSIGFLGKKTLIIDFLKGEVIGSIIKNVWETKTVIEMNNGFNALLKRGKGFFSRKMSWTNDQYGDFVQINCTCKCTRPFTISLDQNITKAPLPLTLIALLGVNLILVKQAQAAAIT